MISRPDLDAATHKSGRYAASIAAEEDQEMKHLFTGVAVMAALAFSAPLGAQPVSPGGVGKLNVQKDGY